MTVPVIVEKCNGHFFAVLVGAKDLRAGGPSRSQAIAALKAEIRKRIELGELVSLEIEPVSVSSLAGKYANDPTLRRICKEAYQKRSIRRRK